MPTLREIDAPALKSLLDSGKAYVVDVRDPDEHAIEHIQGATSMPLSRFDPTRVPADNGQRVILHCLGGARSAEAAARLLAAGRDATHLKGGLKAWKAAGFPTQRLARAPIPIMRQTLLVVGLLVLTTTILAAAISPWFLLLTGFFGSGMIFAGTTGICGMSWVLGFMPWNKSLRGSCCGDSCSK